MPVIPAQRVLLQELVSKSSVRLGLAASWRNWCQSLSQGIVPGATYSAELFARTLSSHLGELLPQRTAWGNSWLKGLRLVMYADDMLVLATYEGEMAEKLQQIRHHLSLIGLHLAMGKLQTITSPCLQSPCICVSDTCTLSASGSPVSLGILIGFSVEHFLGFLWDPESRPDAGE